MYTNIIIYTLRVSEQRNSRTFFRDKITLLILVFYSQPVTRYNRAKHDQKLNSDNSKCKWIGRRFLFAQYNGYHRVGKFQTLPWWLIDQLIILRASLYVGYRSLKNLFAEYIAIHGWLWNYFCYYKENVLMISCIESHNTCSNNRNCNVIIEIALSRSEVRSKKYFQWVS